MKILVTCPPMLGMKDYFVPVIEKKGYEVYCPEVTQTLSEDELVEIVPNFDGWIIGDDPATRRVLYAGSQGKLRAAVKWGVGTDNVDFAACDEFGIFIKHTPNMFGTEVSDLAFGYLIALARHLVEVDRAIRNGQWLKPRGISLAGKTVGVVGFGDIGKNLVERCVVSDMIPIIFDPNIDSKDSKFPVRAWPSGLDDCDFLAFTCALTNKKYKMLNSDTITRCKDGVRIINVARGPLIDESALLEALICGKVHSVALDVFEVEPLPFDSKLVKMPNCILGSHNASNTVEAVMRTSQKALELLFFGLTADNRNP